MGVSKGDIEPATFGWTRVIRMGSGVAAGMWPRCDTQRSFILLSA